LKKKIPVTILAIVMLSMASLVGCAHTETRTNTTLLVGQNPSIEVAVNGNITLVVGSDNEITVTADLKNPDIIDYTVSQKGDKIIVGGYTISCRSGCVSNRARKHGVHIINRKW
jgi:hypothetical protein